MKFDKWKLALSIVWVLAIASFVWTLPAGLVIALQVLGALLAIAHLGEYVVFRAVIAKRPESAAVAFAMTFLFGTLYWKDLPRPRK